MGGRTRVGGTGAIIILFAIGGDGGPSRGYEPRTTLAPMTYQVTYQVEEGSRASVTYNNAQGNTEQKGVRLPWEVTYKMPSGEFAYISAQNQGTSGSVTCHILLDGMPWEKATSSGRHVIATCSGSVGR